MLVTSSDISQYTQNRGDKCEVEKSLLPLSIYSQICKIVYYLSRPDYVFPYTSLSCNGPWWLGRTIVFATMRTIINGEIFLMNFSHIKTNQEKVECITYQHVHSNLNNQVIFPENALTMYLLKDIHNIMGDRKLFPSLY